MNHGWLEAPVRAQVMDIQGTVATAGAVVNVDLGGENGFTPYARTRRNVGDLVRLDPHFPAAFFARENLRGKKILDLACGEGRMVEQLRRENIDIVGLDIHLTPYMLSKPYFIKASAHRTGLPAQSFDIIFSSQGPFKYLSHQPEMMEALMAEAHRLLKTGGVLRISPIWIQGDFTKEGARPEIDLQGTIFTNLPKGMRLKSWPDKWWFFEADPGEGHQTNYWLELERYD